MLAEADLVSVAGRVQGEPSPAVVAEAFDAARGVFDCGELVYAVVKVLRGVAVSVGRSFYVAREVVVVALFRAVGL